MSSLIAIIAIVPPAVAFLLFSIILFLKYRKKRNKATLYFMLAFIFAGIGFSGWAVRSIFYPAFPDTGIVFFWHKFAYLFSAPFCTFFALAALEFLRPRVIRKTRNLILFVMPMILLEVGILFSAPSGVITVAGQTDGLWSAPLSYAVGIIIALYLIAPNYVFIRFLMENPEHLLYGKVMLMEIGLIIFTLAAVMEGSKTGMESWGLFIRWVATLGALLMMYSYIKR